MKRVGRNHRYFGRLQTVSAQNSDCLILRLNIGLRYSTNLFPTSNASDRETDMEETINRRRFLTFAGAAGTLGTAGCLGGGEEPPEEDEGGDNGNGGSGGQSGDQGEDRDQEGEDQESDEPFDFPPGADDAGIVTETVVAGARQTVQKAGRYRIEQEHELDFADAPRDGMRFVDDVGDGAIHERLRRDKFETDRWVTPDRTVTRHTDTDAGRTSSWRAATAGVAPNATGTFERYPFEATTVPALLESASLDFEEVVTDADRRYARYAGEIGGSALELRQPKGARFSYRVESVSEGEASLRLGEDGAIRAVEYEFSGEAARLTHEGREVVGFEANGSVELTYEGLDPLAAPEWAAGESAAVREFEFAETSLGRTYKLASGQPLPGSIQQEYAEFYLTAQFGDDLYIDRYSPREEFDSRSGVVASLHEGELEFDWASMPGRDVLREADRIEMSIYLYAPGQGRFMVYHEERYPSSE